MPRVSKLCGIFDLVISTRLCYILRCLDGRRSNFIATLNLVRIMVRCRVRPYKIYVLVVIGLLRATLSQVCVVVAKVRGLLRKLSMTGAACTSELPLVVWRLVMHTVCVVVSRLIVCMGLFV